MPIEIGAGILSVGHCKVIGWGFCYRAPVTFFGNDSRRGIWISWRWRGSHREGRSQSLTTNQVSDLDQGTWKPRSRALQKQPHAQRFFALHGHQALVSAEMIGMHQHPQLRLIVIGILLEPGDSVFDGFAKAWADGEAFLIGTGCEHGEHLPDQPEVAKIFRLRSQAFSFAADGKGERSPAPDYRRRAWT